ncbi:hypothetical protein JKF63_04372 [Porcisia hertigi]|uniref:Uncharacterized protein n=1 Tax=Porcisia hertigi TaxID=2761500 RepID=A0A836ISB9_9TRYP|nr:hypothetical protein JKF63_04372 [Porcisia hertigi]
MHSHTSSHALPALRRQQQPPRTSTPLREGVQHSPAFPAEDGIGLCISSSAADSQQNYGLPWNTPKTLHTLATSVTNCPQEAAAAGFDKREYSVSRSTVRSSRPLPRSTCCEQRPAATPSNMERVVFVNEKATTTSSSQVPDTETPAPKPEPTTGVTAAVRAERLRELEEFLQVNGGRHNSMEERHRVFQKVHSLVPLLYPPLSKVMDSMRRYVDDVAAAQRRIIEEKAKALQDQEKKLYTQFETFFEGKIRDLIIARQEAEARAKSEHAAAFALRQERDQELMAVKEDLMQRLHNCEKKEDQFRDFRHLIASVFQTNQQLHSRIAQLEEALTRHGIVPPAASPEVRALELSSERQPSCGDGDGNVTGDGYDCGGDMSEDRGGGGRRGTHDKWYNSGAKFISAARQELVNSRLTLQEELVHSAFNDRSAYRMRIAGLSQKNLDLTFNVSELEAKVRDLYTYIHEKRFAPQVDEAGKEMTVMTPRPRDVPLALQTELGVELRHSTADILSELSALAINMKHQLTAALLQVRQLQKLSSWLSEGNAAEASSGGVAGMLERVSAAAVIPLFPANAWPSIPHFLRTSITPDVPNYFWTDVQVACILYNFFKGYKKTRQRARFVRDDKMLAPRVYQLFEHSKVLLTRLDATKEDVAEAEENVPFGYVVTQFARDVLANLSPKFVHEQLMLALPGTVSLRFHQSTVKPSENTSCDDVDGVDNTLGDSRLPGGRTPVERLAVEDCPWQGAPPIVELELTRFLYNLWYAAVRYQTTQPLCNLFLRLVDGQMPIETFDLMETVLARLQGRIEQAEGDRTRRFPYLRLVKAMVRSVDDIGSSAGTQAVRAVVQTFERNNMPLHGGYLGPVALFADETYCRRGSPTDSLAKSVRRPPGSGAGGEPAPVETVQTPLPSSLVTNEVPMPTSYTAHTPPSTLPPLGATSIVSFCRRLVHDTIEKLYTRIEVALCSLVEESEIVLDLYLLSLPRANAALAALYDNTPRKDNVDSPPLWGADGAEDDSRVGALLGGISATTLEGARLTAESADLLGVRSLTRGYFSLLGSRMASMEERRSLEKMVVKQMLETAVQRLPRFKKSTHFPFHTQAAAQAGTSGVSDDGDPSTGKNTRQRTSAAAAAARPSSDLSKKNAKHGGKQQSMQTKVAKGRVYKSTAQSGRQSTSAKSQPSVNIDKSVDSKSFFFEKSQAGSPNSDDSLQKSITKYVLLDTEDGDLVEWYSLRHAMRSTMPSLPWNLFKLDDQAQEGVESSPPPSASAGTGALLPTLKAQEVSATL